MWHAADARCGYTLNVQIILALFLLNIFASSRKLYYIYHGVENFLLSAVQCIGIDIIIHAIRARTYTGHHGVNNLQIRRC